MSNSGPLSEKSFKFAIRVVNLANYLVREKKEFVLSKQLLRSGTAIGALTREARHAESRLDFVHKLSIALKEATETEYWILLLHETNYLTVEQFKSLHADIDELLSLLTSIIKTMKRQADVSSVATHRRLKNQKHQPPNNQKGQ